MNTVSGERNSSIDYNDIFSDDSAKQADVAHLFATLLERREEASSFTTGPGCSPHEDSNSN